MRSHNASDLSFIILPLTCSTTNWPRSHVACQNCLASVNSTCHTTGCRISLMSWNGLLVWLWRISLITAFRPCPWVLWLLQYVLLTLVQPCRSTLCHFASSPSLHYTLWTSVIILTSVHFLLKWEAFHPRTIMHLRGLKGLKDPPCNVQQNTRDCICYLSKKLGRICEWNQTIYLCVICASALSNLHVCVWY